LQGPDIYVCAFCVVRSNYSTQFVFFPTAYPPFEFGKRLKMMTRLNRAGRAYLEADPSDIRKGIAVLEATTDDLCQRISPANALMS
jgi:hypothetical protein